MIRIEVWPRHAVPGRCSTADLVEPLEDVVLASADMRIRPELDGVAAVLNDPIGVLEPPVLRHLGEVGAEVVEHLLVADHRVEIVPVHAGGEAHQVVGAEHHDRLSIAGRGEHVDLGVLVRPVAAEPTGAHAHLEEARHRIRLPVRVVLRRPRPRVAAVPVSRLGVAAEIPDHAIGLDTDRVVVQDQLDRHVPPAGADESVTDVAAVVGVERDPDHALARHAVDRVAHLRHVDVARGEVAPRVVPRRSRSWRERAHCGHRTGRQASDHHRQNNDDRKLSEHPIPPASTVATRGA